MIRVWLPMHISPYVITFRQLSPPANGLLIIVKLHFHEIAESPRIAGNFPAVVCVRIIFFYRER